MKHMSFAKREQLKEAQKLSHEKENKKKIDDDDDFLYAEALKSACKRQKFSPDEIDPLSHLNDLGRKSLSYLDFECRRKFRKVSAEGHLDALKFTFAVLVTGSSYGQACEFGLILGHDPPSQDLFYAKQKILEKAVNDLLREKLTRFQNEVIEKGQKFIACFDGAFSHPRNSNECVVDIVHPVYKKIFAYAIIEKKSQKNQKVDYEDSSKALEITAVKALMQHWEKYHIFSGYCHDLDSSAKSLIEKMGLKLKEYYDHNHCSKHFEAIFNGVIKLYPKALYGIQKRIQIHFSICVHADKLSAAEKEAKWRGCYSHFTSEKSKWAKKK